MNWRFPRVEWRAPESLVGAFWDTEGDFEIMPSEVADGYNRMSSLLNGSRPEETASPTEPDTLCLPCIRCGIVPQPVFPEAARDGASASPQPPRAQPLEAVTFRGIPAYGSEHDFGNTNGRTGLEVNLCDGCLSAGAALGRVNLITELRSVRTDHREWKPS